MAVVTGIAFPLVMIAVRNYIIDTQGMRDAGYCEAMNRISSYYLMFINSIMALYFLPRFAEINNKKEFRKEVFSFYKTIIPFLLGGLVFMYVLRSLIIRIVFTDEFAPVENLFLWQLFGDFLKVLSMVIAYQFLAKKMFWHYILTEAFLVVILYATSIYFIDVYDSVKGAVIAHFVSYVMYYAIILLIFGSSLFGVDAEKNIN